MIGQGRKGWWNRYWFTIPIAAFVVLFTSLLVLKHNAFNTRTYDFACFDQAIWNTLHGRVLFSTIHGVCVLGNHFSPFLAFLAPLFLIWNDPRALFVVQAVSVAMTGYFLSEIVRDKRAKLAPWFLVAFLLNPAVHEITLFEFRRVVPAMPFIAAALYALSAKKRWWMLACLFLALLCKENVAFVVAMVGLYLLVVERDWKWGAPIVLLGVLWVVAVSLWVIPAFSASNVESGVYPQLYYFSSLGDSYDDIWRNVCQDPRSLLGRLVDGERLLAIVRVLVPLGVVLPFLAPGWAAICLPSVVYMMLSDKPAMYRFEQWYLATVIPVLFAAVGLGLTRLSRERSRLAMALLMVGTAIGFVLYSPAPLGGSYEPNLYKVSDHHHLASEVIRSIPDEASVAALPRYVPHLAHRKQVYHYPWISAGLENMDYILLDRQSNPYPFTRDELNEEIDRLLANPAYPIELEADGIYLFATGGKTYTLDHVVDNSMQLVSAEIAAQDERGLLGPGSRAQIQVDAGNQLRVSLVWRALKAPEAERTISVRVVDTNGAVVAQHDGWPARGIKPTSWWEPGWEVRDVHYMTVPAGTAPGPASVSLLVYDSYSQEIIPFEDGQSQMKILPITIVP